MSEYYCSDCGNHEDSFNEDGACSWCWREQKELTCLELTIARNVPPGAYGYCRGFIPEGTDRIVTIK